MTMVWRTIIQLLICVAWVIDVPLGSQGAEPGRRPNILLIVSEDNGPELGCYGDPYAQTPHLDRLAETGARFERAFVPYSVCSPSRAVFLTGLYPHQNGQIGLATHKFALYDPNTPNAFTLLKAAGYRTGLIGKLHINPESAFPVDFRKIRGANFGRRNVEEYAAAAAEFFAAGDEPFFLSINYPDAHLPFLREQFGRPSKPMKGTDVKPLPWVGIDTPRLREVTADYYNCLKRLDEGIGLLMAELTKSG
jgi:N-sulfoglucosamine sulfohydrolase